MTGAVTALGDTLFPTTPALGPGLLDKVGEEMDAANHFLVRLRAVHPLVAILTALWLMKVSAAAAFTAQRSAARTGARAVLALVAAETLLGLLNVALAAPGWLQLLHLLAAQSLWVAVLLAAASSIEESATEAAELQPAMGG